MGTTGGVDSEYLPEIGIPFDLFVLKKHNALCGDGTFHFTDSFSNLLFEVESGSSESSSDPHYQKLIIDAAGDTLVNVVRVSKGKWEVFKGNSSEDNELMFKVERITNTITEKEFEVFIADENNEDRKTDLRMKGCPFKRSCTIYKGNSIMAQSSRMYTIGFQNQFVPRNRFRITLFPGPCDLLLVISLFVVFLYKRKFWE
ncbi:hypothetical protein DM860_012488 [Cuscuta australis]|uniref:Uncharacterized protein n=1 Tax=Cuscuta australis TaxID=267555 RepID=A0A328DBZ7_9ASTE|nr:hypothetical protein DM860_012488 [Cuscuta australis]